MLTPRSQVAAKIESVEGVAETLAAADAFLVFKPTYDPNITMNKRDPARGTLGQMNSLPGERSGKLTFDTELAGSGTPGTPPAWGKLLKACGAQEIIVSNTSVQYLPASNLIPSMSLALYLDGVVKKIWGARGDAKLALEKGKPGILSWTFTGSDFSLLDAALLSGVSYSSVAPPVFLGATFAWDTYAAIISKLGLELGNKVELRDSANALSGFLSALITSREPKATFDPELVTCATKDFFGKWRSSSGAALSCTLGATAGNIVTVSAPNAQLEDIKPGDRKGIRILQLTAGLKMSSGDDDWSILLT